MSAVMSAPAPITQAMSMLEMLSDPKKSKEVLAQFSKAQEEALAAQRAAEETIVALATKQEDLANRERNITNREANVDKWEASLNQAQCDWNAKQLKLDEEFKVKVMTFEASKSEQLSQLEAREATVASEQERLTAWNIDLQQIETELDAQEKELVAGQKQYKADKEALSGWVKEAKDLAKRFNL